MRIKITLIMAAALFAAAAAADAHAYLLPSCGISSEERSLAAEDVLGLYEVERDALGDSFSLVRLEEHARNPKLRLSSRERDASAAYDALRTKIDFWRYVTGLKDSLEALHGSKIPAGAEEEADQMAKRVIETLYRLSQEWRVGGSAIFHNVLINTGSRKKGFCYQYVDEIRRALSVRQWREFDIHWGTAHGGRFTENNGLVITAKGRPFREGMVIDAWRRGGKPFWTKVKGDRFPWVEEFDVVIE